MPSGERPKILPELAGAGGRSAAGIDRTIERREKHTDYRQTASLEEYVLVAQDRREVTVFRRATGWQGEVFAEAVAVSELRSLDLTIAVREIYEDVLG